MRVILLAAITAMHVSAALAASETEIQNLKTYCKPDIERLCHGVEPGNGALQKCLKTHEKQISVGCAEALKSLKS